MRLSAHNNNDYKRLRAFGKRWLQERTSPSLASAGRGTETGENAAMQKVIRWNAQTVAARLRVLAR